VGVAVAAVLLCVANTSPLVALASIRRLDLLQAACEQVLVPEAVAHEISPDGEPWIQAAQIREELQASHWLRRAVVVPSQKVRELKQQLGGSGEAEVIALAFERKLPAYLDELAGRRAAAALGLHVFGSLYVLKSARESGRISRARPLIEAMLEQGIYFHAALIERFLRDLGEI